MEKAKDVIIQAVQDAWKERLTTCFTDGKPLDEDLVSEWKQQTLAQVEDIYAKHIPQMSNDEIENCINKSIQDWKESPPKATATSNKTAAATSFSLFDLAGAGGGGGLSAFFSWPLIAEKANDEIWQALLTKVEYLDDVFPDWTTEIRPWIRSRLSDKRACSLYRQWYGKARQQDSPETTFISSDLMEDVCEGFCNESLPDNFRNDFLQVGLDMVVDYMVRKATCPSDTCLASLWKASFAPPLMETLATKDPRGRWLRLYLQTHPSVYRNMATCLDLSLLADSLQQTRHALVHRYTLALLANLLVMVRVSGIPWDQWKKSTPDASTPHLQVFQLLWKAVIDPETPHRGLYTQGLEALLAGSKEQNAILLQNFQKEWVTVQDQSTLVILAPLSRFAKA